MKIEDLRNDKTMSFIEVNDGDCFEYRTNIYIKIPRFGIGENALDLDTGELAFFDNNDEVIPLNAKLVIEN